MRRGRLGTARHVRLWPGAGGVARKRRRGGASYSQAREAGRGTTWQARQAWYDPVRPGETWRYMERIRRLGAVSLGVAMSGEESQARNDVVGSRLARGGEVWHHRDGPIGKSGQHTKEVT